MINRPKKEGIRKVRKNQKRMSFKGSKKLYFKLLAVRKRTHCQDATRRQATPKSRAATDRRHRVRGGTRPGRHQSR